jgi:hypothetical protein
MSWSHVLVGVLSHASGFALAVLFDVVKRRLSARLADSRRLSARLAMISGAGASWAAGVPSTPADPDDLLAHLANELRSVGHEVGFRMVDDPDRGRRMVLTVEPRGA